MHSLDLQLDVVHERRDHRLPQLPLQLLLLRVLVLGRLLDHRDALDLLQKPPLPHLVHVLVLLPVVGPVVEGLGHQVDVLEADDHGTGVETGPGDLQAQLPDAAVLHLDGKVQEGLGSRRPPLQKEI